MASDSLSMMNEEQFAARRLVLSCGQQKGAAFTMMSLPSIPAKRAAPGGPLTET
jgi:hypothetical protein